MIYFDNSATTKTSPTVAAKIYENLTDDNAFGNPGSLHKLGSKASSLYSKARMSLADNLGCKTSELFFTSCGTESANTAILGFMARNVRNGNKIISTKTEHKATLEVLNKLSKEGYNVVYLPVKKDGKPDLQMLENELDSETALMCFTHVNNETGSILPLKEITDIRKKKNPKTALYLDCVQSMGKLDIRLNEFGVDMASFSGHKIHAVKGVGLLYVKAGIRIEPLILGGGQQDNMRSGTQSIMLAQSIDFALSEALENHDQSLKNVEAINSYLREELTRREAQILSPDDALPYVLNVSFKGFESENMLHCLEMYDIYVSTVSACSSKQKKVSYVLLEAGVDRKTAANAVRLSFSRYNTMAEAEEFIKAIDEIYKKYLVKR